MRDIILTAFVFGSLPFILKRPQLGVIMFVWLSVMNPHRLTWSFASNMNFAAIVAVTTLCATLLSREVRRPPLDAVVLALVLFACWTSVTTLFAIHPESYERWAALMKTLVIAFLIPMLFHTKEDLRLLIWTIVLSLGFYGTKGGMWTLLTGGDARVWGPADSYIADNNSIAVAIIMVIPLMRYLQQTSSRPLVRWALAGMMVLCGVAVLGTYSRGALLAISAVLFFLWWKGRHKFPVLVAIAFAVPLALTAMPEKWHARMETIKAYQEEGSAQLRLNSWVTMINIAKDRPILGAGFEVATFDIYRRYSPQPDFPPQVAHSIYFEALGAHGFVGLALYLFLLGAVWRQGSAISQVASQRPELAWARHLGMMMQVSLIGFAVGGAFLSLVNFDVPYYLAAVMATTFALLRQDRLPSGTTQALATASESHERPRMVS